MQLQVRERQGLPGVTVSWDRGMEQTCLQASGGDQLCPHLDSELLASRTPENAFLLFQIPQLAAMSSQQSREASTGLLWTGPTHLVEESGLPTAGCGQALSSRVQVGVGWGLGGRF